MVTLIKYGALTVEDMPIPNGSVYTEVDTGKTYMFDKENVVWYEVSLGGGVKPEGGIILVGETTTPLTDGSTTNPIVVDGQSYTAQPNDAVIYGNKEFLYTGTRWIEFGDVSEITAVIAGIDHTENNYIEMKNGVRLYISSTAPTGNIPDGSVGVGW